MLRFKCVVTGLLFVPLTFVASGCATTRAQLPPKAKAGLTQIADGLRDSRAQVTETVTALRAFDRPGTDIPEAFDVYSRSLDRLNKTVEMTRTSIKTADSPAGFFSEWDADLNGISDTQLREAGKKRYASARRELERLHVEIQGLRDRFEPFHRDLNDVAAYLKNDPTRTGVKQVDVRIRRILKQERPVVSEIDDVQAGIQRLLR